MSTSNTITKTDLQNIINSIFPATTEDMTQAQIETFIASLNCTGINAVNYVVENGSATNWQWRKWNDGRCEAWGYVSQSVAITTASTAYGGYRTSDEITHAVPSGVFNTTPQYVLATKGGSNSARLMNMHPTSTTNISGFYASSESVTITVSVYFYVIGTWK